MDVMSMIQPTSKLITDVVVRADDGFWAPTDKEGKAFVKVLWTSPAGGWAVLFKWKKGYVAPAHKHLGSIHCYVVSGRLKIRDVILEAGDYIFEPNGIIHSTTETLEDTIHINIADGPLLFFDDDGLKSYLGWEQMERASRTPK